MLYKIVWHEDRNSAKNDVFQNRNFSTLVFHLIFRLRYRLFYRLGGGECVGGGRAFHIR